MGLEFVEKECELKWHEIVAVEEVVAAAVAAVVEEDVPGAQSATMAMEVEGGVLRKEALIALMTDQGPLTGLFGYILVTVCMN